jgi:hypothetical protein
VSVIRVVLVFTVGVLLAGCAASLPYSSEYPLTQESFVSRDGILTGRIPLGWFSFPDDTLAPAIAAWLVRDDLNAMIALRELAVDARTSERIRTRGLHLLAELSIAFQTIDHMTMRQSPEEYSIAGRKYCGYELSMSGLPRRLVVFALNNRYYECEAVVVRGDWADEDVRRLFSVQQSMLGSLQ